MSRGSSLDLVPIMSRRKRARTPTPGHYLGLKSTRDYGKFKMDTSQIGYRGDRGSGRYRGGAGRDDYPSYRRSPRRSPYRGGRDSSLRHSPYGGRSRRDRSRSLPYSPYGSPDRRYARGSRSFKVVMAEFTEVRMYSG
ncbi:serine/arginine-rich splicing factor SR45a-like [Senna tora]|uniref:Serine/arginine-rich splicing factor SR45a-like n=1 Tax=Senna tora TaxID=362788 RepID=A0A834WRA7_9FABA|nr:serine/arginine-rich splicing factor SR45a-like [Senna tora]